MPRIQMITLVFKWSGEGGLFIFDLSSDMFIVRMPQYCVYRILICTYCLYLSSVMKDVFVGGYEVLNKTKADPK